MEQREYKIVPKLIANRLWPVIPWLVESQQKGFVHGRQLQDNILGFRLGQELVKAQRLNEFFLKLDFVKAYDRVETNFLWGTMEAMGFCSKFVKLVKGLALLGTTKVHFNGIFTDPIMPGRGVKQGVSTSPWTVCTVHPASNADA
jgi:hypothetical protein